jgi:hypothetical protein
MAQWQEHPTSNAEVPAQPLISTTFDAPRIRGMAVVARAVYIEDIGLDSTVVKALD